MNKQCHQCNTSFEKNSSQWKNKKYCSDKCRKVAHRKKKSLLSRTEKRRANMPQNEEFIYIAKQCIRAGTVQILSYHSTASFTSLMELIKNRPNGNVHLCHVSPVKGKHTIGRLHTENLFYAGAYQNSKFGNKSFNQGLSIKKSDLESQWQISKQESINEILLKIEKFLGAIISEYLEKAPVRKSKRYQMAERIVELEGRGEAPDSLMHINAKNLIDRWDKLRRKTTYKIEHTKESKFLAYMDSLTRFIEYASPRADKLKKIRDTLVISYMALEREKESQTYNKLFYVKYEPLIKMKYAFSNLNNPDDWSKLKDLTYDTAFNALQGESLKPKKFRRKVMSYLNFPKSLEELRSKILQNKKTSP